MIRDEVGEGVSFTVNTIVQDYYWDADTETFVTTAPEGIVRSDYKTMDIVVMWRPLDADVETFERHDSICFAALNAEGNACTDDSGDPLFGGGIRLVESLPSSPPVLRRPLPTRPPLRAVRRQRLPSPAGTVAGFV